MIHLKLEQIQNYIDLGFPIIPCCDPKHEHTTKTHNERCNAPGKTPMIKGWQERTVTTTTDVQQWITQFKDFNVGLPLGEVSGYVGIDVDGDEGIKILMQMSGGDLPSTWEYSTGMGQRLLYKIPKDLKCKKFKQQGKGKHEECALICTGQQTILPPSMHHTGTLYEWADEHSPDDIECADAPDWLIQLIKIDEAPKAIGFDWNEEFNSSSLDPEFSLDLPANVEVKSTQGKKQHKTVVTPEMLEQPIAEGQRDNTMTAIVGHYCALPDFRRLGKEFILDVCQKHNQNFCQPPLEDNVIVSKVNYFFAAEASKTAQFESKGRNGKRQFSPSELVFDVLNYIKNKRVQIQYEPKMKVYYYTNIDKGPWLCVDNTILINKWIRAAITDPEIGDPTWDSSRSIDETRRALEEHFTSSFESASAFDIGVHQYELSKYIVVNNGMYDWENNQLLDWNPEYKTTMAFDINFEETADCPNFENYLSEWLPDEDTRMALQEYLGLCLIPDTNFRKALFLFGKGANGKSMLIEFLQRFFNTTHSALSYDDLSHKFKVAELKDKLVNICDDTTLTFAKETSKIKSIIAGGKINVEFKGGKPFDIINTARFIYSSQNTPRVNDITHAWYERWIFVKFPNKFKTSPAKKREMERNMQKEISGIFNWLVTGLKRLKSQDNFTYSEALEETTQAYREQNDNVLAFVREMFIKTDNPDNRVGLGKLYDIYKVWLENDESRCVKKRNFSTRLEDSGYVKGKGYADGKPGATFFSGILFNKEAEDYLSDPIKYQIALTI